MDRLEPAALRIGPGVEEREDPLQPVRLLDRDGEAENTSKGGERREDAQACARDEIHGHRDRDENDRGAEIRLGHDEPGEGRDDEEERQDHR